MLNDATLAPACKITTTQALRQPAPSTNQTPGVGGAGVLDDRRNAAEGSYSQPQLLSFLEVIAGNMATLSNILAMAQTCEGDWELGNLISAAQAIAESAGNIADHAVGESVIGDLGRWHCGPNFKDQGVGA